MLTTMREEARDIPVFRDVDVVVVGGGASGWAAALASARAGARTVVVERQNVLGGNLTAGIMGTMWTFNDQTELIVKGIPLEFATRLVDAGATIPGDIARDCFVNYDTEMAKYVILDMCSQEPNLEILFYAWVSDPIVIDGAVRGVIFESKSGRAALLGKVVIDASGDGDVVARAGAELVDIPAKGSYPVSLMCKLGNVDVERIAAYYQENPQHAGSWTGGQQYSGLHVHKLTGVLEGKELDPEHRYLRDWFLLFYNTPRPREIILNMTGATEIDGTQVDSLTNGELVSRRRHLEALEVLRRHVPGFEDAYIMSTSQTLGVRETRRIVGRYTLTRDDIVNSARFPDAVATYGAQLTHHDPAGRDTPTEHLKRGTRYEIPYRCLLPSIDGVIVAGRMLSADARAITSVRNMTSSMAIGQGAGIAAAVAARLDVKPAAVPVPDLQAELLKQAVHIESARLAG